MVKLNLTLNHVSMLLAKDKSVISRHIQNIFKESELIDIQLLQNLQQFRLRGKEKLIGN
jgi:hypothetical protein